MKRQRRGRMRGHSTFSCLLRLGGKPSSGAYGQERSLCQDGAESEQWALVDTGLRTSQFQWWWGGEEPGEHRGSGWAVGERGSECSQLSYAETDGVVAGCRGDHRTMVGTFSGEKSQSLFLGSSQ